MAEFVRTYIPDPRFRQGVKLIFDAIDVYIAARQPVIAARLQAELSAMESAIRVATESDARKADTLMAELLESRLVRPATRGPHLAERIHSLPLDAALSEGALGYAATEELDRAVDPDYPESGTYWRAIEEGSEAQVGRVLVGYFQPGFAAPAASEFRQHPYFTPGGPLAAARGRLSGEGDSSPAGLVKNPIEAKHFLRDGSAMAAADHDTNMRRIQSGAIDAMLGATAVARTP